MALKWDINRALRSSELPAAARQIVLTLSDLADVDTGVIPDDRTPSLRELGVWTGLGKGPVAKHLNTLEELGWVTRIVPPVHLSRTEHVRTRYALSVGKAMHREPRRRSDRRGHVPEQDMPCPPEGHGNSDRKDGACPPAGQGMSSSGTRHVPEQDKGMSSSGTLPYTDDIEQIKNTSSSVKPPKAKRKSPTEPKPVRADVEQICERLADRIEANGSKRPPITAKWRDEARLLIDKDGRTVEQVLKAIDWCQADPFWLTNILSMPKLREKYDQLRLAAQRPNGRASPRSGLIEHNGMLLKPETVADLERTRRFEAMDATNPQPAIGAAP